MAAVTVCSDFRAQEKKICHCFHFFSSICHEVMGPDAMILGFWMLSFKPAFSLSPFTFILRLFSSSSLSAIRVVSPEHLRLLVFLPIILIPACDSSSLAFCMMYAAYKLNKQGDNIQPWHNSFPNFELVHCSMSSSNCCFLTYIQISQEAGRFIPVAQLCLTLQPHEPQHARPPCPSPTPRVHLSSCPLSWWCNPTISSSVVPFSSCPQSFPASGPFPCVSSSHEVAKVLEFQLQLQS